MTDYDITSCDAELLNRFMDDELTSSEKVRIETHLAHCAACRHHISGMADISEGFRQRVDRVAEAVDFSAMEKEVVIKALRRYRNRDGGGLLKSLKFAVPATAVAGVLMFFAYSQFLVRPTPVPSAIINSFTGSMSSVMIFETPETRQTILWYNESTDAENDNNAV